MLPGFSGLRVPTRFYMLAVLCLAVAAGLAFAAVERRFARGRPVDDVGVRRHVARALRRRDPAVLRELRRGHPLYVLVAFTDQASEWAAFMDQQGDAQLLGIQGGGRLYRMPPTAYATEVRPGTPIADATVRVDGDWLVADVRQPRGMRGLELRTHGKLLRLPRDLRIETSVDGTRWETAFDDRPGGLALIGALQLPRVIPLRVDLRDVTARYVRVNVPSFGTGAMTVFAPLNP